jgi:hypothetical protein
MYRPSVIETCWIIQFCERVVAYSENRMKHKAEFIFVLKQVVQIQISVLYPCQGLYPRGKAARAWSWLLVPRLRMMELYLHSPICLPDIFLNYITKYRDNFFFYLLKVLSPYSIKWTCYKRLRIGTAVRYEPLPSCGGTAPVVLNLWHEMEVNG